MVTCVCIVNISAEKSWTGVVINEFKSNTLANTKWEKNITVHLHGEIHCTMFGFKFVTS